MAKGNCDNCGAPLAYDGGLHCDYCGTVYERPHEDFTVKVHSCKMDKAAKRMFARGLMSLNEARSLYV